MAIALSIFSHWFVLMALVALTGSLTFAPLFGRGFAPAPARAVRVRMGLLALAGLACVMEALAGQSLIILAARLVVLAILFWQERRPTPSPSRWVWAIPLLLTQSLSSRSAGQVMPLAADFIHLGLAAVWLGGVGQFALVYAPLAWRNRADPNAIAQLSQLIARFSPVAMFCVLGLGMTGIAQSAAYLPSVDALWMSAFGRALAVKLILFGALVALGAFHQQVIAPKLRVLRGGSAIAQQHAQTAAAQFARSIAIELAASGLLLLAVGAMLALPLPV
ncbi:MAG TPA: CopD family protein [Thermoflexales bacterium]|nr:CopD family protein [Thermoflexales bacterium]